MANDAPMVKGSNVRLAVKALRAQRAALESRLPPDLHRYLSEHILPGSWYPEADNQALMRIIAAAMPVKPPECWRVIGREAASDHATGLYASMLQGGPQRYFAHFSGLWSVIHNSGSWQTERVAPNRYEATLADFAVGMPEYGPLMEGYLARVLELSGAADIDVRCVDADHQGARWSISWR
jgi:uncharacterized protein (TIGR02265 family)